MPNWKTYDSSVRLIAAIVAAHPELKLNYNEIAANFGGGLTGEAIRNRLKTVRVDIKDIKEARANGQDPLTVTLSGGTGSNEIAECFGSGATKMGMEFRFRRVKTDAKKIREARKKGIDPGTLEVDGGATEIAICYGGGSTYHGGEGRFRKVKADAKKIKDALKAGIDPATIVMDGGSKEIAKYYGDCTPSALDHRFRKIKASAKELREAIAETYGDDTTGKAVSTRFERMKKEPAWQGSGSNTNTPTKRKAQPNKNKTTPSDSDEIEDDEEEDVKPTPSKKGPGSASRVQNGRVTKPRTPSRKAADPAQTKMMGMDDDDDDDLIIVHENYTSGGKNGGGTRHHHGYAADDDDDMEDGGFFEAQEDFGHEDEI